MAEPIELADFTQETQDGAGSFDVFMRATKVHIAEEFNSNRITGSEYATVYLGALNATADRALEFLLRKDEQFLKNLLIGVEIEKLELDKENAVAQRLLIEAQTSKVGAEIALLTAQTDNTIVEQELIQSQIAKVNQEIQLLVGQTSKVSAEISLLESQTALTAEQAANAFIEGLVLNATKCKLEAEFNLLLEQIKKAASETGLIDQRIVTETAQTNGGNISDGSVLGSQVKLYERQADGFLRDAEQKASKIVMDCWNVQRTTDSGVNPPFDNSFINNTVQNMVNNT